MNRSGVRRPSWGEAWRIFRRQFATQPHGRRALFLRQCARVGWRVLRLKLGHRPVPQAVGQERLAKAYRSTIAADYRAIYSHRPKPYTGCVLWIRTPPAERERILFEPLPMRGWDGLQLGPVEVVDLACEHLDLLNDAALGEGAARMATFLRVGDATVQR